MTSTPAPAPTPAAPAAPTTRAGLSRQNLTQIIVAVVLVIGTIICYVIAPQITQSVLAAGLRQSVPIILGALCGLLCERSGVINIGIEGMMLSSSFTSFMATAACSNIGLPLPIALALGLAAGLGTGALIGAAHAFMSIKLKVDQIISGTVLNTLAIGLTGYFYVPGLRTGGKLPFIEIPGLSSIPLIGQVLFNNPPITYAALLLVPLVHYLIYHTRWGLRTRAVGEHPHAAATVGVNVNRIRWINVILGAMLAGLAGAFLPLEAVGSFERNMTNGRGFVALAVMIFGKWTPFGALGGAIFFGLALAMNTQLNFLGLSEIIPPQFVGMLPYLMTVIVLSGFIGRARPPAAIGQVYEVE